jgi:hypothetical protein
MASFTSSDNNNNTNNTATPDPEESLYEEDNKLSSCAFDEEWEKDGIVDFFRGIVHLPTITAHHSTYAGQPIFIQTPRTKLTLRTEAVYMLPTAAESGALLPPGDQGHTGAQGHTGTQGNTGAQGHTGTQSDTGAQGDTGTQGNTGAQGDTATSVSGARIIMNITTNMPGKGPIIETHEIA